MGQMLEDILRSRLILPEDSEINVFSVGKAIVRMALLWLSSLTAVSLLLGYLGINIDSIGDKNHGTKRKRTDLDISFEDSDCREVKESKRWRPDRAYMAIHEFIRKMFGSVNKTVATQEGEEIPLEKMNPVDISDKESESSRWSKVPDCNFISAKTLTLPAFPVEAGSGDSQIDKIEPLNVPNSPDTTSKKNPSMEGDGDQRESPATLKSVAAMALARVGCTSADLDVVLKAAAQETQCGASNNSTMTPSNSSEVRVDNLSAPTSPSNGQTNSDVKTRSQSTSSTFQTAKESNETIVESGEKTVNGQNETTEENVRTPQKTVYNFVSPFKTVYRTLTSPKPKDGEIEEPKQNPESSNQALDEASPASSDKSKSSAESGGVLESCEEAKCFESDAETVNLADLLHFRTQLL